MLRSTHWQPSRSTAAMAAEPSWDGAAERGTIFTSGNTDTQSINANFMAKRPVSGIPH